MAAHTRMHGELIRFEATDKLELDGMLCAPVRSKTCVVQVHGMTDSYDGLGIVDAVMRAAFSNGMSFFTFDNRGYGTITVFRRLKEHLVYRTIGTSFENFKDCLFDIDAALKMIRGRGYKNFILVGHSTGCQKSTYYQSRRNKKSIKAIVLLAPADDLNYQIKMLGRRKYNETLEISRRLVRSGKGKELMPPEAEPSYFCAKRYYELYRPGSLEGNIYNFSGPMKMLSKIRIPVLSLFGSREEYAVLAPRKMLNILSRKFQHPYCKEVLVRDADHCFCLHENEVEKAVANWLQHLLF
jgi:pimeloyl-ACP methyl ester carboxylesterase